MPLPTVALFLLAACSGKEDSGPGGDTGGTDTGGTDTAGTADTGDTATGDTDTADTSGDTADTGADTSDTSADTSADTSGDTASDADGDGVPAGDDCDDTDPDVYPGAPEWCDGRDTSCRGAHATDDGLVTWFPLHGAPEDRTALWSAGTADAPATVRANDGTIAVCPGTWYVLVRGNAADMTVQGVGPVEDIVLDGGRAGTVVYLVSDGSVALDGLTIQNGSGREASGFVISAATTRVNGCVVQDNGGPGDGGGGMFWYGDVTLTDTVFRSNESAGSGGGLFVYYSALDARDVAFVDNVADSRSEANGGGLYWRGRHADAATLDGVTATGNRVVTERGMALGGGLAFQNDGTGLVTITRATLTDNHAIAQGDSAAGGGIGLFATAAAAELRDVVADDNEAVGGQGAGGGAVYASVGGSGDVLVVEGVSAANNVASSPDVSGGGALMLEVHAASGTVRLDDLTLTDNLAFDPDGSGGTGTGGGLWLDVDRRGLAVSIGTTTVSGGSAVTAGGAQVWLGEGSSLSVVSMLAQGNESDGLRVDAAGSGATVEIVDSAFLENLGAGVSVVAGSGEEVALTLPGDAHAHTELAGNGTGLALACGASGGSCTAESPWVDFVSGGLSNLTCDVDVDGACVTGLADAAALRCWSEPAGSGCK